MRFPGAHTIRDDLPERQIKTFDKWTEFRPQRAMVTLPFYPDASEKVLLVKFPVHGAGLFMYTMATEAGGAIC